MTDIKKCNHCENPLSEIEIKRFKEFSDIPVRCVKCIVDLREKSFEIHLGNFDLSGLISDTDLIYPSEFDPIDFD